MAETRERIVAAGAELLHGFPVWNWSALTVRAVAARAGINERTVYRYFPSERDLRDAVLGRMREEAGVELDGMRFEEVAEMATRILRYVSSFPITPRVTADPSVAAENTRQRQALLAAVEPAAPGWSPQDQRIAAGILDVLWSPVSYERLVVGWDLTPDQAIRGVTWVMDLVRHAIMQGPQP